MTTARERVIARHQARTAAAGPLPPAAGPPPGATEDPAAEAQEDADTEQRLADLEATLAQVVEQVDMLQQAAVEDALADVDEVADPAMAAALPDALVPKTAAVPSAGDTVMHNGEEHTVDEIHPAVNVAHLTEKKTKKKVTAPLHAVALVGTPAEDEPASGEAAEDAGTPAGAPVGAPA